MIGGPNDGTWPSRATETVILASDPDHGLVVGTCRPPALRSTLTLADERNPTTLGETRRPRGTYSTAEDGRIDPSVVSGSPIHAAEQ